MFLLRLDRNWEVLMKEKKEIPMHVKFFIPILNALKSLCGSGRTMANSLYYVASQTWVARVTDDGARAEYRKSTGRWVRTTDNDIWWIRTHGRAGGRGGHTRPARNPLPPPWLLITDFRGSAKEGGE